MEFQRDCLQTSHPTEKNKSLQSLMACSHGARLIPAGKDQPRGEQFYKLHDGRRSTRNKKTEYDYRARARV